MQSLGKNELTIIIPAFNEEQGIGDTLRELSEQFTDIAIIVVNDGSTDQTSNVVKKFANVTLIEHDHNRGYGAALKTGMRYAKTNALIWFDADNQHRAEDIIKVAAPVCLGKLDANLGVRQRGHTYQIKRVPGKWILKLVAQFVARRNIPDLNCGLRAFRTDIIKKYLHLLPDSFSASSTTTLLMLKRNYRVGFEPITTRERTGFSTVKIFRDGIRTLTLILRIFLLFDALIFFSFMSFVQFIIGASYSFYIISINHQGMPILGAMILLSGVTTFFLGLISSQISEMRQERFE